MGSKWKLGYLREIVDFTPRREIKKGQIASFVSMADISENCREISNISQKEFSGGGSRFANGDTIFARITPCLQNGKTAKVSGLNQDEIAHGSTEFIVLAPKYPDSDEDFIYYLSRFPEFRLFAESRMQGSTGRQRVAWQDLADFELSIPSKHERKFIGKYLASLDNKIALNRQINQTLEQMAQALFKSWFVDFDPVIDNALDVGNEIPESLQVRAELRQKVRTSQDFQPLPADIRALFPAEFEESELGWVPKGWELLPVSKAILINPSVKLTKGTLAKFADMKALPTTGYSVEGIETKPYSGGAKFQKNDVLLARITPCLENGKTGFVDFLSEEEVGFGSTEFVVLRATKKIHFGFVACLARDDAFRAHAIQSMVGSSGRQRVQNSCFDAYQIAVPEQSVMSKFSDLVEVSFSKMTTTNVEIASLSQLRDTLLPKLISGELRLDDLPDEVVTAANE